MADVKMTDREPAQAERPGIKLSAHDREVLRRLARRVAELAARECEAAKRDLWFRKNALVPARAIVHCSPENGWNEIIAQNDLECVDGLARAWEFHFRQQIFWGERMGDDYVIEPVFNVYYAWHDSGWGMQEERHASDQPGGSYSWDAPLKDWADMARLHFPEITLDHEATRQILDLARDLFSDILAVQFKGFWWWSLGMTLTLVNLRGLQQIMMDMCANPAELHRMMAFLRDAHMARLDWLESNGLLRLNNRGDYVGSGGFGYTNELPQPDFDGERVRCADMWGFSESQETVGVSPVMFEEFIFQYQLPLLERFGLNCYGCCEPLHLRWNVVKRTPRLRRVSVSPWADLKLMADQLEDKYIYSMKPHPAALASPCLDQDAVRKGLREALAITRGCHVEMIMKDTHTIGRNPQNVIDWCRIAKEEAERAS